MSLAPDQPTAAEAARSSIPGDSSPNLGITIPARVPPINSAQLDQQLPFQDSGNNPIAFTSFGLSLANQQAGFTTQPYSISTGTFQNQIQNQSPSPITISKPNIATPPSFIGQIPFFLNAVLSTPVGALPKKPLWVVVFEFDQNIKNTIKKVRDYEPRMPEAWQIDGALEAVTTRRYQEEKGCMFAQTVTVPGDSLNYKQEGINYNSFIRGGVATGRRDFDPLRIGFLNTNVSFVDNVIRPWVVMTGHLGMIARPPSQKYRCNITIYKLGITTVDKPPYILQQYNFWEACPINVFAESLDYTDGTPVIKEAEFVYQWYTTSSLRVPGTALPTDPTVARAVDPNAPIDIRRPIP
jgi:hypothetical protein